MAGSYISTGIRGPCFLRRGARCAPCSPSCRDSARDERIDAVILEIYLAIMRALGEHSAALPADRFAEIAFEDLIVDPAPALARLWLQLDLPAYDRVAPRIETYRPTISRYRIARHRLIAAEIETHNRFWAPEIARYGRSTTRDRAL